MNGDIDAFDVSGSKLVVGVSKMILSLSADSLQSMADVVKFEKVHNDDITSLVLSKDGKYYLFTLIKYLCFYYDFYVII